MVVQQRVRTFFLLLVVANLLSCEGDNPFGGRVGGRESSLAMGSVVPGDVPSRMQGAMGVGGGGDLSYSVSLQTPPGRAGMTPQLSLSYSSAGGVGYFGVGFNLNSGASVIQRCGQTVDLDGEASSVHFDEVNDRLCLDGARLVTTNATTNYWDPGAEYRVADGSFVRVRRINDGSHSFEVTQRDGTRMLYGGGKATERPYVGDRDAAGDMIGNNKFELAWHLERVVDVSGNYVQYVYDDYSFADNAYEHRLLEIRYTGNDAGSPALAPQRSVLLHYEGRDNIEDRFFAGVALRIVRRIAAVEMKVHGSTVREYEFEYTLDGWGIADRLTSMRECDRFGVCRSPTTFTWSDVLDAANGVQELDLPNQWDAGAWEQTLRVADLNGDGFDDLVYSELDSAGQELKLMIRLSTAGNAPSNCTGGFCSTTGGPSGPGPFFHDYVAPRHYGDPVDTGLRLNVVAYAATYVWPNPIPMPAWFEVYDHDQDGQEELVVRQPVGQAGYPERWNLYTFNGTGLSVVQNEVQGCQNGAWQVFFPRVADFNGDGAADMLGSCATDDPSDPGTPILDRRLITYDWDEDLAGMLPLVHTSVGDDLLFGWNVTVDLDGDGQSEVISSPWHETTTGPAGIPPTPSGGLVSVLSVGSDPLLLPAVHLPTTIGGIPQTYTFVDVNGDGLRDAFTTNTFGSPTLFMNTGRGFGPPLSPFDTPPTFASNYQTDTNPAGIQVADFDHDGREDLLIPFAANAGRPARMTVHLSTGSAFRVVSLASAGDTTTGLLSHVQLMDINGDGQLEYSQAHNGKLEIRGLHFEPANQLIAVDDGGHSPSIDYYLTNNRGCDEVYPRRCAGASWAVATTDEMVANSGNRETAYLFEGAISDVRRRQWLGYALMQQRRDELPDVEVEYDLRQDDYMPRRALTPFAMRPARTTQTMDGRTEETVHTYSIQADQDAVAAFRTHETLRTHQVSEDDGSGVQVLSDVTELYSPDPWGTIEDHVTTNLLNGEVLKRHYELEDRAASFQIGLVKEAYTTHTGTFGGVLVSEVRRTDYGYDGLGRPNLRVVEPDGALDERLEIKSYFDEYGNVELVEAIDDAGETRTQQFEFDADHTLLARHINALGHTTDVYQDAGLGVVLGTHAYDPANPTEELNHNNLYDGFARLLYQERGDVGDTLAYEVDIDENLVVTSLSASGAEHRHTYDTVGRLVKVERLYGQMLNDRNQILYEYDIYDRLTLQTNWHKAGTPTPAAETFEYDGWSRAMKHTNLVGAVTEWAYDGRDVQVTAPGNRIYNIDRDHAGRVSARREPLVNGTRSEVTYTYGPFGQLATTTDVSGNVVRTFYDGRGRLSDRVDPDSGTSGYQYNAFGDMTWQSNGAGESQSVEYDVLGRVVEVDSSVDGMSIFTYDTAPGFGMGQLHQAVNDDAELTFGYDDAGRTSLVIQHVTGYSTLYAATDYEPLTGRVSQVRMPSFSGTSVLSYEYANYGETQRVRMNGTLIWTALERNDPLRRTTREKRGPMTVKRDFDPQSLDISSYYASTGLGPIVDRDNYQYSADGRLEAFTDATAADEGFEYDARGRLTHWTSDSIELTYSYDGIGNQTLGASGLRSFGGGSAGPHAVSQTGGTTFTYDGAGRRVAGTNGWSAEYTTYGLPTRIETPTGNVRSYRYDALQQRVHELGSDGWVQAFGDLMELDVPNDTSNATLTYPIYAEGERVAEVEQTISNTWTRRYLNSDGVGTSIAWSKSNKQRVAAPVVEPFGAVLSGSTEDHRFASHEFEPQTALVNAKGRMYDPSTASFLSTDPIRLPTQTGMNLYMYAAADPVNLYDPTGFVPDELLGGGGGAASGLGGVGGPPDEARSTHTTPVTGVPYDLETWDGMRADAPVYASGGLTVPRALIASWHDNGADLLAELRFDFLFTMGVDLAFIDQPNGDVIIRAYQHLHPPWGGVLRGGHVSQAIRDAQTRALNIFGGDGDDHTLTVGRPVGVLRYGTFAIDADAEGNLIDHGFAMISARHTAARYVFSETSDSLAPYTYMNRDFRLSFGVGMQLYHEFVHYAEHIGGNEPRVVGIVNDFRRAVGLPWRSSYTPVMFESGRRTFIGNPVQ